MRYKRDSESNANNKICFEDRAPALCPRLHTEGFLLCPHKTFHKGTITKNYNSTLGVHYSSLKHDHLYTRGIGTKLKLKHNHLYTIGIGTKLKQRKDYNLGDHNRPQTTLGDYNRSQIIFLTKTRSYRQD